MSARNTLRRGGFVGAIAMLVVLLASGPAAANVGMSQSLTVPVAMAVGQTASPSFTVRNTNTPPHESESQTLTSLRLAPGCGAAGSTANPCPTPDLGVFSATLAGGAAGTACAGVSFTVSAPDASGIVTFTPASPVTLGPPSAGAASDRCTVNFTLGALKIPGIDTNGAIAGVQTRVNLVSRLTSAPSNLSVMASSSVEVTVVRATPTVTTQASPSATVVGNSIVDTATIAGVAGVAAPTGTVTFQLFGPGDTTCTGTPIFQSTNAVTGGSATSGAYVVTQPGVYRYTAAYSGDANYVNTFGVCNEANESVTVSGAPVHRPVDYNGDGKTDFGVYRPSTGGWFVAFSGGGSTSATWGASGDVPVPGDYNGDGRTDFGVYRPTTGGWFVAFSGGGSTSATWGTSGDVPVPGDYNGDGKTDFGVYRPTTGGWFVAFSGGGSTSATWGASGDVPVPGDYNGDGRTDFGVYRPTTAGWFVAFSGGGSTSATWGASGDVPVPGDYNGDGRTDFGVYRPTTGGWYVALAGGGTASANWGASGDVPLPLPWAIWQPFYGGP